MHCPTGWVDPFGLAGGQGNKGRITYRGDTRGPEELFNEGFKPCSSTDLRKHALDTENPPSNFVSTSTSEDVAAKFASSFYTEEGFIYIIKDKRGIGINVNKALGTYSPHMKKAEIAFSGGIKSENILGITPVDKNGDYLSHTNLNPNIYGKNNEKKTGKYKNNI